MGRKVAMLWHASFSVGAGVLYFYFVLPRWPELMGDTSHALGTTLRIVTGVLVGLTALPVVFTLLRTRKPELGTPQLALSLRTWSIVVHVLAGALIIGTAISEIWLDLDTAGQWLFGIYGAAVAVAVLAFFGFYLSFVAELPPPPPKPLKSREPRQRRIRRRVRRGRPAEAAAEKPPKPRKPRPPNGWRSPPKAPPKAWSRRPNPKRPPKKPRRGAGRRRGRRRAAGRIAQSPPDWQDVTSAPAHPWRGRGRGLSRRRRMRWR